VSKTTPSPSAAATTIAKHLYRITHQHFFKSFDDWLALAVNAFLRDDDAYMTIMRTYGPREPGKEHPADHFAHALGAWMLAMQQEPADYLGRVYEEQAVTNTYAGQFFTPEPLTELMAAMTMPDELSDNALVSDPACGSGRMLIAGIRRNRFATFLGTDTDLTCVHMTALNCLVRNATTYVIHGNSLSLETHGGFYVRRSPFGGELHRLAKDDTDRLIRLPLKASPDAATALSALPAPSVQEATPETTQAFAQVANTFTTNKRGQGDFGF
jgi:type I restriction-modification system DNA methylase subunit